MTLALHSSSLARRRLAVCHPAATRPMAAGRRLARPPLPAIRDLDRAPPPPQALGRPSPPSARPAPPAPGRPPPPGDRPAPGGTPGHPRHGISSAKNGSADFGGLKIDPKNRRVFNFCTKRCAVYFWAGIEKIKAIERILRKIFTKNMRGGQNLPPFPVRVLTLSGLLRFTEAAPPRLSWVCPGSAPARCDRAGGEAGGV